MADEEKKALVKPLVWSFWKVRSQLHDTKGVWDGRGIFNYELHRNKHGKWVWSRAPSGSNFRLPYTDLRSCKKAAEEDYKTRVIEALK